MIAIKKLILSVVLVLSFSSVVSASPVETNSTLSTAEQEKLDLRTAELETLFITEAKLSQKVQNLEEKLNASLESSNGQATIYTQENSIQLDLAEKELTKIKSSYADHGLIKVSTPSISPFSNTGDFDDNGEFAVYYDNNVGKYLAHYGASWKNENYYKDANEECLPITGCSAGTRNIGGPDGVGIFSLHRDINVHNPRFYTFKKDLTEINRTNTNLGNPTDARGAGYIWQETAKVTRYPGVSVWSDYDSWRILTWYHFTFANGTPSAGSEITIKAEMGHTWKNVSVNSLSVGPWSVGIGFSSGDEKFLETDTVILKF